MYITLTKTHQDGDFHIKGHTIKQFSIFSTTQETPGSAHMYDKVVDT